MIVVLLNVYLLLLFILVKLKIVPFNLFWKISPVIVLLLLLIGLFIPMNWGAPQGPALVVRNSVPIVPDVAGVRMIARATGGRCAGFTWRRVHIALVPLRWGTTTDHGSTRE